MAMPLLSPAEEVQFCAHSNTLPRRLGHDREVQMNSITIPTLKGPIEPVVQIPGSKSLGLGE